MSVAVIASITALFLRGFNVNDLVREEGKVTTPNMEVWVVKTSGFASKMDAYKVAISNSVNGFAEHIMEDGASWSIIEGVYLTSEQANSILQNTKIPETSVTSKITINSKEFKLDKKISKSCDEILNTIKKIFLELNDTRNSYIAGKDIKEITLSVTEDYNLLKNKVDELQNENINFKDEFISTVIYSANQSLLGLFNLLFSNTSGDQYLSALNTAITKVIFSLDNF